MAGDDRDSCGASKIRIKAARRLLFDLASGQADQAPLALVISDQDEFAQLEVLLNAFSIEFQRAREQNRQLEAERLSLIAKLQSALAALAAPIIDIWEGIVVLPLIGPIDDERAQEITSRLLDRLQRHQIATVIVDLTGVTEASDPLARHLSRLFSAVRLLGVRCAISGISPAVAREMVRLGVDWPSDIHRSLAEALHATVEIQPSRQQVAARMRRSAYE